MDPGSKLSDLPAFLDLAEATMLRGRSKTWGGHAM